MKGRGRWATLAAISALAALLLAASAHAAFPGTNGKIAFERDGEIYSVKPDGSGLVNLTQVSSIDEDPAWTAAGRHIAFNRMDGNNATLKFMNSNGFRVTHLGFIDNQDPAWSPDSRYLAFEHSGGGLSIIQADPAMFVRTVGLGDSHEPAWSPDGTTIAYSHFEGDPATDEWRIRAVQADGSGDVALTTGPPGSFQQSPNWSPDGTRITFVGSTATSYQIFIMNADGSGVVPVPNTELDSRPSWSPDGTKLVVQHPTSSGSQISIVDPATGAHTPVTSGNVDRNPDWGPAPTAGGGYARPKGATPVSFPLVPAYRPCDEPNREHGPPYAFGSCNPAQPESEFLTVGTPDANTSPAKFAGSVTMHAIVGNPATPADESDVRIEVSMTDVRCKTTYHTCGGGPLSDYAGELQAASLLRITDFQKGTPASAYPMTVDEFFHSYAIPCAITADATVGSTCSVTTSVNATTPGSVEEGARTMWQLGRVEIRDGGPDGSTSTDDYTLFATQGFFVP